MPEVVSARLHFGQILCGYTPPRIKTLTPTRLDKRAAKSVKRYVSFITSSGSLPNLLRQPINSDKKTLSSKELPSTSCDQTFLLCLPRTPYGCKT